MPTATVLGWYDHGNAGDESYRASLPLLLENYELYFTDKIQKPTDIYILGGGHVLSKDFLTALKGKPNKHIISVTATEDTPFELLKDFKSITVRDFRSQNILEKKGVISQYAPDLAFLLKPKPYDLKTLFHRKELYQKVIGIVVNAHLISVPADRHLSRDFITFNYVAQELARIIDQTPASFIFLPFGQQDPYDDRVSNAWVAAKCKYWKKNIVLHSTPNYQELLDIISCCDVVISTRLHCSIFACMGGVPFIDITHHDKNLGFLESVGLTDWSISYWQFDVKKCKTLINDALNNKYREDLHILAHNQVSLIRKAIHVPGLQ